MALNLNQLIKLPGTGSVKWYGPFNEVSITVLCINWI